MNDMRYIRNAFKKKFCQFAQNKNVEITNEWELPIPEENCILQKWKSRHVRKIMSLQEEENEDEQGSGMTFCYVVDTISVYSEKYGYENYNSITILVENSHQHVETIFDIYKLWFIENKSPEEMESILEGYFTQLNGHPPEYYERLFEETHGTVDEGC